MAVQGEGKIEDLASTIRTGPVGSTSNAAVEPPTGQTAQPKTIELADRVDTVPAMKECSRLEDICRDYYLMAVSCKRGSPVRNVMDMTK
jgi:hypothetical protein